MEETAPERPLTAAEEAVKRNTDCVYFLASPLTCKKGNECEYRHSDGARLNPKDCYYWLKGNCLNPKCLFRHPPLDGLTGAPGSCSAPILPFPAASTPHILVRHAPTLQNSKKSSAPCFFFQKGQCLKGEKCPYIHAPQPSGTPATQQVVNGSAFVAGPLNMVKKESMGLAAFSQQKILKVATEKQVEILPLSAISASRTEPGHGNALMRRSLSPHPLEYGGPIYESANVRLDNGVRRIHESLPADKHAQTGREAGEFVGESSPGFDVLVDDGIEDFDYHQEENEFVRESVQKGRSLYPVNAYDHSNYEHGDKFQKERLNGIGDYDRRGRVESHYGRDRRRASSEINMDRDTGKRRHREESLDLIHSSDLRNRLSKQRKLQDPSSGFRHGGRAESSRRGDRGEPSRRDDYRRDAESYHVQRSHADHQHSVPERPLSSRLQGRIKLPATNVPDSPFDEQADRQQGRGRLRGRLSSPVRPKNDQERYNDRMKHQLPDAFDASSRNIRSQSRRRLESDPLDFTAPKCLVDPRKIRLSPVGPANHQEKHSDRMKRKLPNDFNDTRNSKNQSVRNVDADTSEFAGPKSLAELKGAKVKERSQLPSTKSTNCLETGGQIAQRDMVNSVSISAENPELSCNGSEVEDAIDKERDMVKTSAEKGEILCNESEVEDAVGKEYSIPEVVVVGQQSLAEVETVEADVLETVKNSADEEIENAEQTEESGEVYEDDVQTENPDEALKSEEELYGDDYDAEMGDEDFDYEDEEFEAEADLLLL